MSSLGCVPIVYMTDVIGKIDHLVLLLVVVLFIVNICVHLENGACARSLLCEECQGLVTNQGSTSSCHLVRLKPKRTIEEFGRNKVIENRVALLTSQNMFR